MTSLKARIRKIEEKLPKEDNSLTELAYHGAKPSEKEMEIALKYTDNLSPPWKVTYIPYEFKEDLFNSNKITRRYCICIDEKLGLYFNGKTLYKLVKKYNKKKEYPMGIIGMFEQIGYYDPDILFGHDNV